MFKMLLTATTHTLVTVTASHAMDRDRLRAIEDRWEADDRESKLNRRLCALEDDVAESREEPTGPICLNNGARIWNLGNNVYEKY